MPNAYTQNTYHVVFSTKDRAPLISPELEPTLYAFIEGIIRDLGCSPLAINGTPDHVHVLARYPSHLSHSDLVRHIKSRSSKWINETNRIAGRFAWQDGYGP